MSLNPQILEQLRASLRNLASPAAEQLKALGSNDEGPVDELALEFDDVARAVAESGWLTAEGAEAVGRLNRHLTKMSGPTNAHLWTRDALHDAPEWDETRKLARQALRFVSTSQPR